MELEKPEEYIATLWVLQLQGYINAACMALWLYDYLDTFPVEVNLIWKAQWNIPKVLFIVARYLPVFAFSVLLYYNNAHLTAEECQTCQKLVIWSLNIAVCFAETIFTLRTWAVWNRGCMIGIILAVLSSSIWAAHLILMALLLPSMQPLIIELYEPLSILGCKFLTTGLMISRNYILITIFYSAALPLMLVRAWQCLMTSLPSTTFLRLVFFDGILYYVALFVASWIIFAVDLAKSAPYASTLSRVQQILCSVLACRLLLDLRTQAERTVKLDSNNQWISSGFASTAPDSLLYWQHETDDDGEDPLEIEDKTLAIDVEIHGAMKNA